MKLKLRLTRLVVPTATALLALSACSSTSSSDGSQSTIVEPTSSASPSTSDGAAAATLPDCGGQELTFITSTAGFLFMPAFVAESAGYYDQVGITPVPVTIPGTQASLSALINGDANFSFTSAQAVITAQNKGAPVIMVGGINRQLASNIVVRKDVVQKFLKTQGVTELSAVDPEERLAMLRGLRIGITEPGAGSDQLVRFLLDHAGMDPDNDAEIIGLGSSSSILSAFAARQVDAFALSSPTDTVAVAQHNGVLVLNLAQGEYPPLDPFFYESIVTSKKFAESNPEAVQCVVTAVAMAQRLLADDPEAAAAAARDNPVFAELTDDMYEKAFQTNAGSWYESPVVEEADVQKVIDFITADGSEISLTFKDVIENRFAVEAAKTVQGADITPSS